MIAAISLTFITAYIIGALISAPKLMRLIYRDQMAVIAEDEADWKERMERARKEGAPPPHRHRHYTQLNAMREARFQGFCWSLVWPVSLAFYALTNTAFKQEIAAQQAAANAKVIADYDALLASRFDKELATPTPHRFLDRIKGRIK